MLPGKIHPVLAGSPGRCRLSSKIHPPDRGTHEKDPAVQAAACPGAQRWGNAAAAHLLLPAAPALPLSKERKQGMCVLAQDRASSTNAMCARLKLGCTPEDSRGNLKRQAEKANKGSWHFFVLFCFFFNNLETLRSWLEPSLREALEVSISASVARGTTPSVSLTASWLSRVPCAWGVSSLPDTNVLQKGHGKWNSKMGLFWCQKKKSLKPVPPREPACVPGKRILAKQGVASSSPR